jgi:hypothetical protein
MLGSVPGQTPGTARRLRAYERRHRQLGGGRRKASAAIGIAGLRVQPAGAPRPAAAIRGEETGKINSWQRNSPLAPDRGWEARAQRNDAGGVEGPDRVAAALDAVDGESLAHAGNRQDPRLAGDGRRTAGAASQGGLEEASIGDVEAHQRHEERKSASISGAPGKSRSSPRRAPSASWRTRPAWTPMLSRGLIPRSAHRSRLEVPPGRVDAQGWRGRRSPGFSILRISANAPAARAILGSVGQNLRGRLRHSLLIVR